MSGCSETELSEAIQECAQQCLGHPDPRACVVEFCARLVNRRNWSESDAQAVEESSLRVIENLKQVLFEKP